VNLMRLNINNNRFTVLTEHLSTEILTSIDKLEGIKDDWNKLFSACNNCSVFQSYTWNYIRWKYFGSSFQLAIVTVRENNKLVGIGPFMINTRLGISQIQPIGDLQYLGLLVEKDRDDVSEAIAEALITSFHNFIFYVSNYGAGSGALDIFIATLKAAGWHEHRWVRDISHYIYSESGFADYLSGKTSKARNNLNYNKKRVEKKGTIVEKRFDGEGLTEDIVLRIAKIQKQSWLTRRGVQSVDSPYYLELIPALAKENMAEVYILSISGDDVAFLLNYNSGDTHFAIHTGFIEKHDDVSAGQVLFYDTAKDILDRNNRIYDLPFGHAEYKRRLCNRTKLVYRVVCHKGISCWILSWFPHRLYGTFAKYQKLRIIVSKLRRFRNKINQRYPHP
jgi:CelD/BcsL family acetyltransferase involved in cellulose biosynthesis